MMSMSNRSRSRLSTAPGPRRAIVILFGLLVSVVVGFGILSGRGPAGPVTHLALAQGPLGMLEAAKVQVPSSMRYSPFNVDRFLNVPAGFSIAVYARVADARFMALTPSGDLLVSRPGEGRVALIRSTGGGDPLITDFATGLRRPHDIVFHTVGATTYVYISETNQVNRFIYNPGDTTAHDRQVVVSGLPDSSTPELRGAYGHELKNIALDGNHKLYVSIASTCNVCTGDTVSNPVRAAIYQYDADGSNPRLFAQGLRNAEGLAFVPGTNDLWVVVNQRDNIAYPYNDGSGNYGRVIPAYVDNHPPDEFTRVRDGANYGWPFCNPNPDTPAGLDNMPFDRDYQLNADGHVNCNAMERVSKGIQAHSAPLGLTFLQDTNFPEAYRQGAVVGLHGSWNREAKTGYKVIFFPWDGASQMPGAQADLVSGWLNDTSQEVWGRPVDVAVDQQGDMFISDDSSGTVYKLISPPAPSGPVIIAVFTQGKSLLITGQNFDIGAVILMDGQPQRTIHDGQNLIGKKLLKQINPGQMVTLQVKNSDGTLSPGFSFTR